MRLMLDTGVLGKVVHPRKHLDVYDWLHRLASEHPPRYVFMVPEIADYELRRKLLHLGSSTGLKRLDALVQRLRYVPLTTATMHRAAALWAEVRRKGLATAGEEALDGDAILGAQAWEAGAHVVTDNVKHLARYTTAIAWTDVT
jgi:predicted nucleic acid-binding protein